MKEKNKIERMILNRKRARQKKRESGRFWFVPGILYILFLSLCFWLWNSSFGQDILNHLHIGWLKELGAKESEKLDQTKEKNEEKKDISTEVKSQEGEGSQSQNIMKKYNYFGNLNEKKQKLDRREKELNELEKELHKQKVEIEKRIKDLQSIRTQIRKLLAERIEMDEGKVNKLVEFYSNMKPQQAAKIMESIDEDLSVAILGRMKKKNAADILNLLQPEKARRLSEMYAGYEKKQKSKNHPNMNQKKRNK